MEEGRPFPGPRGGPALVGVERQSRRAELAVGVLVLPALPGSLTPLLSLTEAGPSAATCPLEDVFLWSLSPCPSGHWGSGGKVHGEEETAELEHKPPVPVQFPGSTVSLPAGKGCQGHR